jgi:hypothetical protein
MGGGGGNMSVLRRQQTAENWGWQKRAIRLSIRSAWNHGKILITTDGLEVTMCWGQEEKSHKPSDRACQSQEHPDAHKLLFSSPANRTRTPAADSIGAATLLLKIKHSYKTCSYSTENTPPFHYKGKKLSAISDSNGASSWQSNGIYGVDKTQNSFLVSNRWYIE